MNKLFVCPKCKSKLINVNNSLVCEKRHTFDIAKQGYVNLLLGSSAGAGDDKDMCSSRHSFHSEDYYRCLSGKLAEICIKYNALSIVDAGCGEGYYLRKIFDSYEKIGIVLYSVCGIDLAKEAISIAARLEKQKTAEKRIEYAVAGIFDMPLCDESADCVLSVFAPVPDKEAYRVLKSGGIMIVVSPGEKHLEGLKKAIYDNVYDNQVQINTYDGFEKVDTAYADDVICVGGENVINLFHMTPYFWKTSVNDSAKLSNIKDLTTKIEFVINIYKKI